MSDTLKKMTDESVLRAQRETSAELVRRGIQPSTPQETEEEARFRISNIPGEFEKELRKIK